MKRAQCRRRLLEDRRLALEMMKMKQLQIAFGFCGLECSGDHLAALQIMSLR